MKKIILSTLLILIEIISFAQPWEVVGDAIFGYSTMNETRKIELINDVPHVVYTDLFTSELKLKIFRNNEWEAPNDSIIFAGDDSYSYVLSETTVDNNGNLIIIYFDNESTDKKYFVKMFDGTTLTQIGQGFGGSSTSGYPQIKPLSDGSLVALVTGESGAFTSLDKINLFKYDGSSWSILYQNVADTNVHNYTFEVDNNDDMFVSYIDINNDIFMKKYDGTNLTVLTGNKIDTNASLTYLFKDDENNLLLMYRLDEWIFKIWDGSSFTTIPNVNNLYASNYVKVNTFKHAINFNPIDKKWYAAYQTNTNSMAFFKRFNGTTWEQVGDSLYPNPGSPTGGKMRFNSLGNPFYTSRVSNVMTMDLGLKTGLDTKKLVSDISIYPNPAKDIVSISLNKDIDSIIVFDLMGNEVLSYKNTHKINLADVDKGVYFLRIQSQNITYTRKVIKN